MKSAVYWVWSSLLGVIARNRTVILALLSAIASALMGWAVTIAAASPDPQGHRGDPSLALLGFGAACALIVLAGAVPREYESARRFETILPVIYRLLKLEDGDRLCVHRLVRFPYRQFEQLTDYYPPAAGKPPGRRFPLGHGIISAAFANGYPHAWSVGGKDFKKAMIDRWSFTEAQVARLTQDRRSFLAYPIGRGQDYAAAVLFIDSPDPARLDEDTTGPKAIALIDEYFADLLQAALKG